MDIMKYNKQEMKNEIRKEYGGKGLRRFLSVLCEKMFTAKFGELNKSQVIILYNTLCCGDGPPSKNRIKLEAMSLGHLRVKLKALGHRQSKLNKGECIERLLMLEDDEEYDSDIADNGDGEIFKNTIMKGYYEGKDRALSDTERETIAKKYNHRCRMCNDNCVEGGGVMHHIQLKAFYGSDDEDNLIFLCEGCHDHWHQSPKLKAKFHIMQGLLTKYGKENVMVWAASGLLWGSKHGTYTEKEGLIYDLNEAIKGSITLMNNNPECLWCGCFESWCECEEGKFEPRKPRIIEDWLL
jgi:5-methylcytosine-specific restriction endonuclease McrA